MQKEKYGKNFKLGLLGGGQLGRMMIQEAISLDIEIHVLDPSADAPCSEIANTFSCGDFNDYNTVIEFGKDKDLITIEIEHVNIDALKELQKRGVKVFPQPEILEIIQDKGLQKEFYKNHNIPTAAFELLEENGSYQAKKYPLIQKTRKGGYDGKGVVLIKNENDWNLNRFKSASVIEEAIAIKKELSVIVSRNKSGEISTFPVVELVFDPKANLVDYLQCPAKISVEIEEKANEIAVRLVEKLEIIGLLAVELFLTENDEILVNEIAPRTHNSGHQSIEGNYTSQFAQHLRAVLNFPAGNTEIRCPSVMLNLLGAEGYEGPVYYEGLNEILKIPGVYPHIYGKSTTKPYRKMGHITVLGNNFTEIDEKIKKIRSTFRVISK